MFGGKGIQESQKDSQDFFLKTRTSWLLYVLSFVVQWYFVIDLFLQGLKFLGMLYPWKITSACDFVAGRLLE